MEKNVSTPAEELRSALIRKQLEHKWPHAVMARKLAVSRIYWNHVVTGRKPLGLSIAQGAANRAEFGGEFEDLAYRTFLSLNASKRSMTTPKSQEVAS